MARLETAGTDIVVRLSGWEKLGAVSGDLRIRRASIVDVSVCVPAWDAVRGIRVMGTGLPRWVALGRRRSRAGVEFVAVYYRDPGAVVLQLIEQPFARVSVSVPNPDEVVAAIG